MEDLTLQQLESLAIGYFECRLSRAEEEELKKLLLLSPLRSSLLDECRLEMGLEATVKNSYRRSRRMTPARWLAVAASVTLIFCAATFLLRDIPSPCDHAGYYAEVYVNGVEITDRKAAIVIAEQHRRESLERMDSLLHISIVNRNRHLEEMNKLISQQHK